MARRSLGLALALALASRASGQASFGNDYRLGPTVNAQRLCPSGCSDTGLYDGVAFQFVPTSDLCPGGACIASFFFYSGPNEASDASTPTVRVSLQTGPLGSGTELSSVTNIGMPANSWVQADFADNGQPTPGAVSVDPGNDYYFVITTESSTRPSVSTVAAGSSTPVGTTRTLDIRTGVDLSLAAFLSHAGVWGAAITTDAPLFVATTLTSDPWAPAGCEAPVGTPFGNPFLAFDDLAGGTDEIGEQFVHWAAGTCATGVMVQLSSGDGVTATLSGTVGSATAPLGATGVVVDGYQVYSGTFPQGLPLSTGSTYQLALTSSAAFAVRSYSWGSTEGNGCSPQARATWRGATSAQFVGTGQNPNADVWFQISTAQSCASMDGGSMADGGVNADGGSLRSWYACSCGAGTGAAPPALFGFVLAMRRVRRGRRVGLPR
jgi:hypothetical protein